MKFVNKSAMAQTLSITLGSLESLMRKGMPVSQKGGYGKEYQFETGEVIRWLREQDKLDRGSGDIEAIKTRKAEADAQLAELKAGKEAGIYVEIDEVVRAVIEDYIAIKTQFSQMPKRLPPVLVNETPETIAKILDDEIGAIFDGIKNRFITERGGLEAAVEGGDIVSNATAETDG